MAIIKPKKVKVDAMKSLKGLPFTVEIRNLKKAITTIKQTKYVLEAVAHIFGFKIKFIKPKRRKK